MQRRKLEREFWKALSKLKTPRKLELFFEDLLTHTEREMLVKRLQIARMLLAKKCYGEIKKKLHVTDNTIAKVSNWLSNFGQGYRLAAKKI
jgi:TrpR-related protein YerC/YecD